MGQQVLVSHPRYSQLDRHFKLQAPSIPLTMASRREPVGTQRRLRSSAQRDKGALPSLIYSSGPIKSFTEKRPEGIKKEEPRQIRRSARLEGISRLQRSGDRKAEQASISSPAGKASQGRIVYTSVASLAISSR